jgi:hypothetical protein
MKWRNITQIALLELKRKKKTYSPSTLIFLGTLLVIFFLAASLLFTAGVSKQNTFYDVQTQNPLVMDYLEGSQFRIDESSRNSIRVDGRFVNYRSTRSLRDMASGSAFLDVLHKTNDKALDYVGADPKYLVYLNITALSQNTTRNVTEVISGLKPNSSDISSVGTAPSIDMISQTDSFENIQNDIDFISSTESTESAHDIDSSTDLSIIGQMQDQSQLQPQSQLNLQPQQDFELQSELQTPSQINTFAFVKDLFIFIQILFILNVASGLFGTAILEEKMNQRSSLLFLANVSKWDFIFGKGLIYFVSVYLLFIVVLALQYPFLLSKLAIYFIGIVLILLYLSISCLNGLLARNHKEYSFLSVFTITGISLYLLIPAFLANISELSYASLLTPFALYAQGTPVNLAVLFFVIPIYAAIGLLILYVCSVAWDYESLYAFETPYHKLLLLLSKAITKSWHGFVFGLSSVAFGWVSQLLLIAVIISVNFTAKYIVFFIVAAILEEYFRNLGSYALVKNQTQNVALSHKILFSFFVGLGFMLAEKGFLVLTIAPYLQGFELLVLSGLIAPLLLHSSLTYAYLVMAEKSTFFRNNYVVSIVLLGLIHAGINLLILSYTGVILP